MVENFAFTPFLYFLVVPEASLQDGFFLIHRMFMSFQQRFANRDILKYLGGPSEQFGTHEELF